MKTLKFLFVYFLGFFFLPLQGNTPTAKLFTEYLKHPNRSILQDFSYAGYGYGLKDFQMPEKLFNVADYGIYPRKDKDQTTEVQALINQVGEAGGGIIYFPRGVYCFNMDSTKMQYLTIDHSHIVLCGEGTGKDGTVFYSGNPTLQEALNPWLSPFLIRFGEKIQSTKKFWGAKPLKYKKTFSQSSSAADPGSDGELDEAKIITSITQSAQRGEMSLSLKETKGIQAGDVVLLAMYNTNGKSSLLQELICYSDAMITDDLASAKRAGSEGIASFQWLVEINKVEDEHKVKLKQPLKYDIRMEYLPQIAEAPMIREVGIENIRFESAWDGLYLHHGGGKYSPYMSKIMDYGWNAVNFCRVIHGWMRNVEINHFTNPLYIQDAKNVTIENVIIGGHDGHCGIKTYAHASDNLVRNVKFKANFTHMLSAEGNAYGNVFTRISYEPSPKSGQFDFHGFADVTFSPPAWNLFELITGLSTIDGGGAQYNFPHTAKGNIWWNCLGDGVNQSTEIFNHWVWKKEDRKDHHLMYPGSIIIGYRLKDADWEINDSKDDRNNPFIYIESLNQGPVFPLSLYEEQKRIRDNRIIKEKQYF